jgi:hypothetical protein
VAVFLQAHRAAPKQIVLDLNSTDDPLHGEQEGRFFHGYYGHYCYLPLYILCGEHLLCARLRLANIDWAAGSQEELERIVGQIRQAWPEADSHGQFAIRIDRGFVKMGNTHGQESTDRGYQLRLSQRMNRGPTN